MYLHLSIESIDLTWESASHRIKDAIPVAHKNLSYAEESNCYWSYQAVISYLSTLETYVHLDLIFKEIAAGSMIVSVVQVLASKVTAQLMPALHGKSCSPHAEECIAVWTSVKWAGMTIRCRTCASMLV